MYLKENKMGYRSLVEEKYQNKYGESHRILQESSVVDGFLWVGVHHHLSFEQVKYLIFILNYWIENKRLPDPTTGGIGSHPDDNKNKDGCSSIIDNKSYKLSRIVQEELTETVSIINNSTASDIWGLKPKNIEIQPRDNRTHYLRIKWSENGE